MSSGHLKRGRRASGAAKTAAQRQAARLQRLVGEAGGRRLTCYLTPAAGRALDRLTAAGETQSSVVSRALVAALAACR